MTIKKYSLDEEEKTILNALKSGQLKPLQNSQKELKKLQAAAKSYGNKVHRVNIRLTEWGYEKAQTQALREGIPYATFISSIVHKFLAGQFRE
jgi:predicted DNA binding CopG/RHH family protein